MGTAAEQVYIYTDTLERDIEEIFRLQLTRNGSIAPEPEGLTAQLSRDNGQLQLTVTSGRALDSPSKLLLAKLDAAAQNTTFRRQPEEEATFSVDRSYVAADVPSLIAAVKMAIDPDLTNNFNPGRYSRQRGDRMEPHG